MNTLEIELAGKTDQGLVRPDNEDSFFCAIEYPPKLPRLLIAVCDGVGGNVGGEIASREAVEVISSSVEPNAWPANDVGFVSCLIHALGLANGRIYKKNLDKGLRPHEIKAGGMSTTAMVAALMGSSDLFLAQIGDGRAYIWRGDRLVRVTRDQTRAQFFVDNGGMTAEQAARSPSRHTLSQALGSSDTINPDITHVSLRQRDVLLMCSDGLKEMVNDEQIREVLRAMSTPREGCDELIRLANEAGGEDNTTVVIARFNGGDLMPPTQDDIANLCFQRHPACTFTATM